MGAPRKGQGGHLIPLDFDINFSHIITVAPRVEIQMHFWKGAKIAGSVGHPMTKMLSASQVDPYISSYNAHAVHI